MKRNKLTAFKSHQEFGTEYPLASELPYWDFFSDVGEADYLSLSDGTLVMGARLRGVSIETLDSAQVNQFTTALRSVLNSLPDGADIQFFLNCNSDYLETIKKHHELKGDNKLAAWLSEARVEKLRAAVDSHDLQKMDIYLFIYQRVQATANGVKSFFSKPQNFVQVRREEHEKRLRELRQLYLSVTQNLGTVGVAAQEITQAALKSLIYQVLNPVRGESLAAPDLNQAHRTQEFTSEELKAAPELALSSPREQLVFSDVIQGVDSFFLDGYYHRVLTLKTLPEFTHSALISRLTQLPFHFSLSLQLRVPEQSKELTSLQAKRRMAHSMSISTGGRATDLESEAKLQSTEELLRELINTGQKIFYFQLSVLLKAKTQEELETKTKQVLSRFRELNGAEGMQETVVGFKVFKTMLPAGNTAMVRAKRVKTDNLADFLPVYQSYEGDGRPVCLFQNRAAGLVSYDPFSQNLPNFSSLVTGASGSGKSFLNNCILLQYMTQKPLVYVIDIGGSYRKLCEFMGGEYIEITPPTDSKTASPRTINPLLLQKAEMEPSPQKIKFLLSFLETILTDNEGNKLSKLDKSLLEESITETYKRCLPQKMPRLSDLVQTFEMASGLSSDRLKNFAKILYPWTGDRPYGRLFDAENALDFNSDMVVFDLQSLSSYPDLQSVMILVITDLILTKVDGIKDRRKQILMDECWALIKGPASHFMEYCVRTLRKKNSGITFITQGLSEIVQSPIGDAILGNTATKFILIQRGDLEPMRNILKFNDQEMALISSLRQQKGSYSEAFLIANENRSVVRITPTALEYWLATSDASDNALLEDVRRRFPEKELPEIIHFLSKHYPFGGQGVSKLPDKIEVK